MPWRVTSPMYERQRFVLDAEHTPRHLRRALPALWHQPQDRLQMARPLCPARAGESRRPLASARGVPPRHLARRVEGPYSRGRRPAKAMPARAQCRPRCASRLDERTRPNGSTAPLVVI